MRWATRPRVSACDSTASRIEARIPARPPRTRPSRAPSGALDGADDAEEAVAVPGTQRRSSRRGQRTSRRRRTLPARHGEEPHSASQEQIEQVIARLAASDPAHTVTLDALTVALKAAGFQRPPGSPRLVTRLRRMKDIEVLPNGRVRMLVNVDLAAPTGAEPAPVDEVAADEPDTETGEDAAETAAENGAATEGATRRRPRRRGGRRRGGRGRKGAADAPTSPAE